MIQNRPISLLLFLFFVAVNTNIYAQKIASGKINDKNGMSIPGVTVRDSISNKGTVSDQNGNYTLDVKSYETILTFSFIGYATKKVKASENLEIILEEDIKLLNDVIIVGYSQKTRNEIASAVTVIGREKLNDVTANNIETSLQGKVPGLQVINSSGDPGATPELRIRGTASLSAARGPLTVVDGIVGGNYDPRDVESVTVLRDAGATGMYGSQANSGVLIITTKKGNTQEPKFEFRSANGINIADQGNLQMMNGRELYETQKELYRLPETNLIDLVKFTAERPSSLKDKDFNWVGELFKPAYTQNYYLSASGKTGKLDYYASGTYFDEGGTFRNTDYQRINTRVNTTYHFSDKVKVTNNINLTGTENNTFDYNDLYYTYLSMPWDNPFDSNGEALYVDQNTEGWWSRDKINPIHTIDNSIHNSKGFSINYDFMLDIQVTKWLNLYSGNRLSVGGNYGKNYFSPIVAGTYHGKGYLNQDNSLAYGGVSTNLAKFNFEMGKNNLSGLVGYEGQGNNFESIFGEGKGLPEGFSVLDVASTEFAVGSFNEKSRMNSFLSQANYNYDGKYFLTGSFRLDGSSAFTPANRYASFPTISAGWLVSKESFFNIEKISMLKLRVSYGLTGMQDIGAYKYLSLFSLSTQYNSQVGAVALQLPSPDLTWERTKQINFGIDIELIKRISLTFDMYRNITTDLLVQVGQPTSTGFESRWENVGELENKGIDIGLDANILKTRNFEWNVFATFGANKNKIRGLAAPFVTTDSWGISQIYQNEGSLYDFYLKKWVGVDSETGLPLWENNIDADGNPISPASTSEFADADNQVVGNAQAKFLGGFGTDVSWKNFTLLINATYVYGNDVYNNNRRFMDNDGHEPYYNLILLAEDENRWTQPGDNATHPSMANSPLSTETSSRFLEDGSFVKIRNITLSYNLPVTFVSKAKLKGVTLGLGFDNPFTLTNYWGQDPEATITRGEFITPGVNDFKYPNSRKYVFSVNIQF
jgi:TonB-linked SusC/RagA family outer membrane protein